MTRRVSPASSHDRARHGGCRGSHSGFTIIELMTVLIVLGILITVVVVPAVRGMAGRQRVQGVQAGFVYRINVTTNTGGTSVTVLVTAE